MDFINDVILTEAVRLQPEQSVRPRHPGGLFDSHDIIFTIMKHWPNEHGRELGHYAESHGGDPFAVLDSVIAGRLADLNNIVDKCGKVRTMNCRGEVSECELWRKRK